MSLVRAFDVSASGLSAQRTRMEAIASNLANAETTRTAEGGPYRRKLPVFMAQSELVPFEDVLGRALYRVRVSAVVDDPSPPVLRHEPGHPDADADGMVAYPNVDPMQEMIDMLSATRSYEANVTALKTLRTLQNASLDIIR